MKRHFLILKKAAYYVAIFILTATLIVQASTIAQRLSDKYKKQPAVQSVSADPLKNHTDYHNIDKADGNFSISEYQPDKQWFDFDFDRLSIPTESTEAALPDDFNIRQMTYGMQDGGHFVKLVSGAQVKNCTTETSQCLYAQSNLLPDYTIDTDGSPQVLIIHTHTTEGYELYESGFYNSSNNSCTTDDDENVIAIGKEIKNELESSGIGVIHDTTYHDYPSHTGCYGRSAQTTRAILEQYPSIKVVLDIHRDSITSLDGARIAPVVEIDGKTAAQAMIISCCDDGTMGMPDYMQNFRLACLIQNHAEYAYKGLMRPILFDYCKYNQDISTGSLTIEVGSAANSLEQAKYTGRLLGESIARALLSIKTE